MSFFFKSPVYPLIMYSSVLGTHTRKEVSSPDYFCSLPNFLSSAFTPK